MSKQKFIWGESKADHDGRGYPVFETLAPVQQLMWVASEVRGIDMDVVAASYHASHCPCGMCQKYHDTVMAMEEE